jgi:quercetin dioxygenase-like cupin family protein
MSSDKPAEPIALAEGEGEARWFLGSLVSIKATGEKTGGRLAIVEHLSPRGTGSPLHMHTREDEWFHVLEGELALWVGGQHVQAKAGSFAFGPRNIPHTFTVVSDRARFLIGAAPAGFDAFVREASVAAATLTLPPADVPPPDPKRLAELAGRFGIQELGPPGIPQ